MVSLKFVPESDIEEILIKVDESDKYYESVLEEIARTQPAVTSFLNEENFQLLTEEEYEMMWFVFAIIFNSMEAVNGDLGEISMDLITKNEESNWEKMNESSAANFYDKVSIFFENYEQEDLLAFLEDIITPDEDSPISKVGAEIIFISLKSIMDSFIKENGDN